MQAREMIAGKATLYDSGLSSMTNLGDATLMLIPRSASDCSTSVYLMFWRVLD